MSAREALERLSDRVPATANAEREYEIVDAAVAENETLRAALNEYASHQSWRCHYRTRYRECCCGLDKTIVELGLDPVPVSDPEAARGGDAA
jgi:hypothetical protein